MAKKGRSEKRQARTPSIWGVSTVIAGAFTLGAAFLDTLLPNAAGAAWAVFALVLCVTIACLLKTLTSYGHPYVDASTDAEAVLLDQEPVPTPVLAQASLSSPMSSLMSVAQDATGNQSSEVARLEALLGFAVDWVWETDMEHRFTRLSQQRHGQPPVDVEPIMGKTRWEIAGIDIEANADWQEFVTRLNRHEPFYDFRYRYVTAHGETVDQRISGIPIFCEDGEFKGYLGTTNDETAEQAYRTRAEQAEARLISAIQGSPDGVALYDANDQLLVFNDAYQKIVDPSGVTCVVGANFTDLLRRSIEGGEVDTQGFIKEAFIEIRRRKRREQPAKPSEISMSDGRRYLVVDHVTNDGGIFTSMRDITVFHQNEAEIKEARQRLQVAIENLQEGVALFDMDDRLILFNEVFREQNWGIRDHIQAGVTFEELLRLSVRRGDIPVALGREESYVAERLKAHRTPSGPFEVQMRTGEWSLTVETRTPDGGVLLSQRDMTALKDRQAALRVSEARFRDFAEAASDWLWEMDQDLRVSFMSTRGLEALEMSREDILGHTLTELEFVRPRGEASINTLNECLSRHEGFKNLLFDRYDHSGISKVVAISGIPMFDEFGIFVGYRGSGSDITQLIDAEQARQATEARFQDLVEGSIQGILIHRDAKIVYANRACEEIHGYGPGELNGLSRNDTLHPSEFERFQEYRDQRLAGQAPPAQYEYLGRRKDGTSVRLESISRVVDWDGAPAIQVTLLDCTERHEAELAMRQAREAAEHANRLKTEFLANMSHELRTPLNAVIGFSDVMRQQAMGPMNSPRYLDYATDIYSSGRHLLSLIEDVLDVSLIEVGEFELAEEAVDLSDVFRSAERMIADRAAKGGLDLHVSDVSSLPKVLGDGRRIRQILINLMSNAVKFTEQGGTIRVHGEVRSNNRLALIVEDTGIGIDKGYLSSVLEPFVRVESTYVRQSEGLGLGLPLVKQMTELHGGRMDIQSELGVGTKVEIVFPPQRVLSH